MPDAIDPPGNRPAAAPAGTGMVRAFVTHLRRNRSLYLSFGLAVAAVAAATVFWVQHPSSLFAHSPTATVTPDRVEAMFDGEIKENLQDFNRWYKTNIVIQALTIAVGIFSTVFASLATQENAVLRRRAVVVLTAITTALVAIQSTFHIRDNLDTFIKANSDLEVSRLAYVEKRDGAKVASDQKTIEALKLEADTLKSLVFVNEARMRAYSGIGAPQARGASEAFIRPSSVLPDPSQSAAAKPATEGASAGPVQAPEISTTARSAPSSPGVNAAPARAAPGGVALPHLPQR